MVLSCKPCRNTGLSQFHRWRPTAGMPASKAGSRGSTPRRYAADCTRHPRRDRPATTFLRTVTTPCVWVLRGMTGAVLRGDLMAKPQYGPAHQRRRAAWVETIERDGPVQCGCIGQCRKHEGQCPVMIDTDTPFHLGHGVPVAHGGDGSDSVPWCPLCNGRQAADMTNRPANNSRDWWSD